MKKTILLIGLMLSLLLGMFVVSAVGSEEWPLSVRVNDEEVIFPDAQPFVDNNSRTQVPVRFVSEALNANVEWIDATSQVSIIKDTTNILLTIGKKEMTVNNVIKTLDSAPLLKDGRTFVPIRFVSEALGASIDWEALTNTVYIDTTGYVPVENNVREEIDSLSVELGGASVSNNSDDTAVIEYGNKKVLKSSGAVFSEFNDMIFIGIHNGERSNFDVAIIEVEQFLKQIVDEATVQKLIGLAKTHHIPSENTYYEKINCGNKLVCFSSSANGFVEITIENI